MKFASIPEVRLTISFNQPVLIAGAQIAVNGTRNSVGSIAAFDQNDTLILHSF